MRVYVAGPMTKGPLEGNIRRAIDAANVLMANGFHPFVPHFYYVMQITCPQDYERWMALDFAFVSVCEALLRIPGESSGADREIVYATECGIPVFHSIHDLISYRDKKSEVRELAPDLPRVESPQIGSA